jgi:hypothetical protein
MARKKTPGESVRAKLALAERLVALRSELHGNRGAPQLARQLGIPCRTWQNYETGVTIPAEVILKIIKLTSVEAEWLLDGNGPKFRSVGPQPSEPTSVRVTAVLTLLRSALHLLESSEATAPRLDSESATSESADRGSTAMAIVAVTGADRSPARAMV